MLVGRKPFRLDARLPRTRSAPSPCVGRAPSLPLLRFQFNRRAGGCLRMARGVPIWAAEDGPMTNSYARDGFTYGFDFDALIGLLPGIGDAITTAISLYIVHEARQLGAPLHVIMRMLANVALDGFFGAVPVVGDAFDVIWRAKIG